MTEKGKAGSVADRIADLSVDQLRLLAKTIRKDKPGAVNIFKRQDPSANVFPLSFSQEGFWFLEQLMPRNPSFNWIMAVRFRLAIEDDAWRDIFRELTRRHEILRTRYIVQDGSPVQIVDAPGQASVRIVDLRGMKAEERDTAVTRFIDEESKRGFDIEKDALCRFNILQLADDDTVLCSSTHLSIIDAWCRKIFMNELSSIAGARLMSQPLPPEPRLQYGDYAAWERKTLQGETLDRLRTYWKKQLQGMPDLELPTDYRRPPVQRLNGAMESALLPKALTDAAKELGKTEGATPFTVFLAAFQILLMLYSGQDDIAVGIPVANRNRVEFEGLLGRFVNTLVLRSRMSTRQTFRQILRHVREVTLGGFAHQDLPFELLVRELRVKREPDRNPLVRVMFQLEDIPATDLSTGAIDSSSITPIEVNNGVSVWDFSFHIFSDWDRSVLGGTEQLRIGFYYAPELFTKNTVLRMLANYWTLLECIVKAPDKAVSELSVLTKDELLSLENWNRPRSAELPHATYPVVFEAQVAKFPGAVAIVDGERELSYDLLNRSANQLASYLRSLGVGPLKSAAIGIESCADLVIAALAVLKTGASLVPLSFHDPDRCWHAILGDTKPVVVLTHERLRSRIGEFRGTVVALDREWSRIESADEQNAPLQAVAGSLACVRHNFSTRIPVTHGDLLTRLQWLQDEVKLGVTDTLLQRSPLTQDHAICEILWPLAFGARLVMAGNTSEEPGALGPLICKHQVTVLYAASPELAAIADGCTADAAKSLRLVLCSGELPRVSTLRALFLNVHCPLWHLYAPAMAGKELAVARFEEHDPEAWWRPISHRTGNARIQILSESLRPVPIGVIGQVYIEDWDNGKSESIEPRERRLATGDLARLREDGSLELVGCVSQRGWVGNRQIPFAEIAGALLQEPSVEDCVVTIRRNSDLENQLIAYVVTSGWWVPQKLHSHLQALLPDKTLPHAYVPVAGIPLTQEGDVDWQTLEAIEVIDSDLLSRWEQALGSITGIDQLAVVAKEETEAEANRLHLADLLPVGAAVGTRAIARIQNAKENPENAPAAPATAVVDTGESHLAVSDGGPSPLQPEMPVLLSEILERAASQHAENGALYIGSDGKEQRQSYAEILSQARRILSGLRNAGLQPGDKVILQLEQNRDFVQAFWGCVLGGFVPVPIAVPPTYAQSNVVTAKLANAWQMLDQPLVIATQKASSSILSFAKQSDLTGLVVESLEKLLTCQPDSNTHRGQPEDMALLLLTSGSTGVPKGVPLSHRNILARATAVTARHGFSADEISINWMPLDHVGGIVTFHLQDVYLGCRQIHVETESIMRSPLTWFDLIDAHRATVTWAPNFAYAMINDRASEIALRRWDLSSMRFILNGGETIVPRTAKKFMQLLEPFGLPKTAMRPAFGMSEASSAVTYSDRFLAETTDENEPFVDLGTPNPGFRMRIAGDDGNVLQEGAIGRFQLAGDSVMQGYYKRDDLNASLFHEGGWFDTGDVGYLRNGSLTLTGRKKDIIIINGANYHCHEIEAIVEEIEGVEVSYTAACPVRTSHADTDQLAIFFSPRDHADPVEAIRKIRARVAQSIGVSPEYVIPVGKEEVPKTSIGKIQRSQMRQRFETGGFDAVLRTIDLKLGNANTLPDWFYKKIWRAKKAAALRDSLADGGWLIFMDREGVGAQLCGELERLGRPTVTIEAGDEFAKTGDRKYRIQPANREHYERVFKQLAQEGFALREIVHLWTYEHPQAISSGFEALENRLECGVYSLFHIAQQVVGNLQSPVNLTVVSSHSQATGRDEHLHYDRAALRGLLKSAKQEDPFLQCRQIDLPLKSVDHEANLLLEELRVSQGDVDVLYFNDVRMIPYLEKVLFDVQERKDSLFKVRGTYLLSGGLGGLGGGIAKYLLEHYGARLLLLGRTPLPERGQWEKFQESMEPIAQKIRTYVELEQAGDVHYEAVDICDAAAVAGAVRRAETRWQRPLDGVIHLAGVSTDKLLREESQESFSAALQTKLHGARILSELISGSSEAVFITAPSVTSFWGATGMAAYCSANDALECFTHYQRSQGIRSYCFSWSVWDGIGMSRGYQLQSAYRMRGMLPISMNQGINSLLVGLCYGHEDLIVGLDGSKVPVRRHTGAGSCQRQRIYGYYTANARLPSEQFQSFAISDRFKTRTSCRPVQLKELPLTESGQVDRARLSNSSFSGVAQGDVPARPTTDVERQLVNIWKDVLGIEQVGIYDDFFALGGYSILAAQLMAAIRKSFGKDLPLRILLERPTVAHLAEAVQDSVSAQRRSPLVPIQAQGMSRPLFLAHPAGGNVLCYYELATELGMDQPLYGLEEAALATEEEASSLEEMARRYCQAVRSVQPMGPYSLGGWSLGGTIAFEMARQLREQGEDILLLAIMDIEAPEFTSRASANREAESAKALVMLCKLLEIYTGREVPVSEKQLENLSAADQVEHVFHQMQNGDLLPPEIDLPYFQRYVRVYDSNLQAMYGYTPGRYDGKIVLFRSTEALPDLNPSRSEDPTMGWQNYSNVPVAVHRVPGNHLTMMAGQNVRALAGMLQSYLSRKTALKSRVA